MGKKQKTKTHDPAAAANFDISLMDLRGLMELRGAEGVEKVNSLGGINAVCEMLKTSGTTGKQNIT